MLIACAGVAGVQAPAFVERPSRTADRHPPIRVSPEFRLRPLLSGREGAAVKRRSGSVAGVQAPAFVERGIPEINFLLRGRVSPEFRLRPLLSVPRLARERHRDGCVAGVQAPAFVERCRPRSRISPTLSCRRSSGSGLC